MARTRWHRCGLQLSYHVGIMLHCVRRSTRCMTRLDADDKLTPLLPALPLPRGVRHQRHGAGAGNMLVVGEPHSGCGTTWARLHRVGGEDLLAVWMRLLRIISAGAS